MTDYLDRSSEYRDPAVAAAFDELSFWSARFGALLFRHLELAGKLRVLDLACGTGFPLFELAHALGSSCRVTGVDVWKEGLERAVQKQRVHQLTNVAIAFADGARLPFAPASFDLIVSNLGINNFEDPRAVCLEIARVAKPGARIALTTNVKGHMREFYEVFRGLLREPASLARLAANEDHRGSKESLSALLAGCGFRVTRVIEDSFEMRYLNGAALLRHPLTRCGFLAGWRAVVEKADERRVFTVLEEKLDQLAVEQGELRMTIPMLYLEGVRA